jgi:hypothetical protein
VRTVRLGCLDWPLILDAQHLERFLDVFVEHYNGHRPHRALALTPPQPTRPPVALATERAEARIQRRDRLGGVVRPLLRLGSGRSRRAHFKFTRMNIALTILQKSSRKRHYCFAMAILTCERSSGVVSARAAVWGLGRVATSSSTKGRLRAIPIQFTVPIDGGFGPQPHRDFIEVSDPPTLRGGRGEVAGAGKDA